MESRANDFGQTFCFISPPASRVEHAFVDVPSPCWFHFFLFIYVCETKKLSIRCWTGLHPWLCPCRCPCRCRRFLLLLLRLFAYRRRSLLGFSSAPRTLTCPTPPSSHPTSLHHLSTVAPPPKQQTEACSQSARRLLPVFFFFSFAARTNSLASSLLLPP